MVQMPIYGISEIHRKFHMTSDGRLPEDIANSAMQLKSSYTERPMGLVSPDWASLFVRPGSVVFARMVSLDAACSTWRYDLYNIASLTGLQYVLQKKMHWNFNHDVVLRQFEFLTSWIKGETGIDLHR